VGTTLINFARLWPRLCYAALGYGALAALLVTTPAYAGQQTATAKTVVVTALSLIKSEDLEFGTIIPTAALGTVTVSPSGVRTATGGAVLAGGIFHAAEFAGRGARRNQQISISFGALSILITRSGGTQTMVVDSFKLDAPPSASLAVVAAGSRFRIVPASAVFDFPVGATLRVGAGQAPGNYTGTFTVTVDYR
jgi:Domain of unknown function (DUF4402)